VAAAVLGIAAVGLRRRTRPEIVEEPVAEAEATPEAEAA
jgi:hypothetical protein